MHRGSIRFQRLALATVFGRAPVVGSSATAATAASSCHAALRVGATRTKYEERVKDVDGRGLAPNAGAGAGGVDPAKISKTAVWGLWNEGNLFSLSAAELGAFLKSVGVAYDEKAKKTALVRLVEDVVSKEQPPTINKAASLKEDIDEALKTDTREEEVKYSARGTDVFEEADVYGDWGVEPNFEQNSDHDAFSRNIRGFSNNKIDKPTQTRTFQLLHDGATADLVVSSIDASRLPGCNGIGHHTLTVGAIPATDANRQRFRRAFKWCVNQMQTANLDGEINIGAGKALYWRRVARHNRNVLPIWSCQAHLHQVHPYTWFAVAHESNQAAIAQFIKANNMELTQDQTVSYKVNIRRSRDYLHVDLNNQLQTTIVKKPWDRFLCSHLLRDKMPDLRFLIRANVPLKKKVADAYFEAPVLKQSNDSIVSVLVPELGDVAYACERKITKHSTTLPKTGVKIQLVETKRTPLIVTTKSGNDETDRLEYELIAQLPAWGEKVDLDALSNELWAKGQEFATILEEGMEELHGFSMPAAAAFDSMLTSKA